MSMGEYGPGRQLIDAFAAANAILVGGNLNWDNLCARVGAVNTLMREIQGEEVMNDAKIELQMVAACIADEVAFRFPEFDGENRQKLFVIVYVPKAGEIAKKVAAGMRPPLVEIQFCTDEPLTESATPRWVSEEEWRNPEQRRQQPDGETAAQFYARVAPDLYAKVVAQGEK